MVADEAHVTGTGRGASTRIGIGEQAGSVQDAPSAKEPNTLQTLDRGDVRP